LPTRSRASFRLATLAVCILALAAPFAAHAQQYTIGSSNTASADPPVTRPDTTPCVVNLYTNQEFADYNNKPFNFAPPANCPGPWSKVVLTGDYYITPGIQYDRTSQIFLNGVNIYFGTTPEPTSATVNDPWHFENDLTSYASLFTSAQTGYASLGNTVNSTYTGIIYGTVNVYFYPVDASNPAGSAADVVYPLPSGGGATTVNSSTPGFTTTLTLPTNLTNLYLDVVSQSQNEEEQWFYCLPNDIAGEFDDCGNTNFRETDITIDGTLAGIAPVSPWIYTGGLDPYLWFPITGNQTLNLKAYRVNLSPFAGALSDGKPHVIGVSVFNAFEYFTETASLLAYEDHGSTTTGGSVTSNTLTAPNPDVTENISVDGSGDISGTVLTTSQRSYSISGTVNTSSGTVTNTVTGSQNFSNNTTLYDGELAYTQNVNMTSTAEQNFSGGGTATTSDWSFPFVLNLTETLDPNTGNISQVTTSNQSYTLNQTTGTGLWHPATHAEQNIVNAADTLLLVYDDGGYYIGGNTGQSETQQYFVADSDGYCYYQTLTAANNALTAYDGRDICADSPYAGTAVHRIAPIGLHGAKVPVHPAPSVGPLVHKPHSTTKAVVRRKPIVAATKAAPVLRNR
jgi:hypothetical protein